MESQQREEDDATHDQQEQREQQQAILNDIEAEKRAKAGKESPHHKPEVGSLRPSIKTRALNLKQTTADADVSMAPKGY